MTKIRSNNHLQITNEEFGITLQILYGEISLLELKEDPTKTGPKDFCADNDDYIRALYRVFKKAEELGYFKDGVRMSDEDGEKYIKIQV